MCTGLLDLCCKKWSNGKKRMPSENMNAAEVVGQGWDIFATRGMLE